MNNSQLAASGRTQDRREGPETRRKNAAVRLFVPQGYRTPRFTNRRLRAGEPAARRGQNEIDERRQHPAASGRCDFAQRELPGVSIEGFALRVGRSLVRLGNQRQLVYYWFQQRARAIDNEFAVKWYLFREALTRYRPDGAMVRLVTPIPGTADTAEAYRRLTDVASRIAPELPRY
jgi:hypothetical protein